MAVRRKLRESLYFEAHHLAGIEIGKEYIRMLKQDRSVNASEVIKNQLIRLLEHCNQSVPYYSELMKERGDSYREDPEGYLADFPVLTKTLIRENFDRLKSDDIHRRKWRYNASGGSTGDRIRLIQDNAFIARAGALQWLSHDWAGRKFGERAVRVWGSVDDVVKNTMGLKMNLINYLTNDNWFNAFLMTPERMRIFLEEISANPPKLIIAYASAIYELAQFAEREHIQVNQQKAILTSAGMMYPFMREKIESVFRCKVFNRYGSRELGDIASECEAHNGLHVFPWGNYIEVVDEAGKLVPTGTDGNLLITNLANFAMPLIRYQVGDRGVLSSQNSCSCGRNGQILEKFTGRIINMFVTQNGTLVDGGYFSFILFHYGWVHQYQVIQKRPGWVLFKFVRSATKETANELDEIIEKTKLVMGSDCEVTFEFVESIPPSPSGKFLYIISEVHSNGSTDNRKNVEEYINF